MSKSDLLRMLESASLSDLKSMIITKEKLDELLQKKSAIEKNLSWVDQQIESIMRPLEESVSTPPAVKKIPATRIKNARRGGKTFQPSIQSLTVAILQEKKNPLSVNEITDCLLSEKKYRTPSANFKNQLRVLLYDQGMNHDQTVHSCGYVLGRLDRMVGRGSGRDLDCLSVGFCRKLGRRVSGLASRA
jgi:hypothetical protein